MKKIQATCKDVYGITWALFKDGSYASRFGSLADWKRQDASKIAQSIIEHLAAGGDNRGSNEE